MEEPNCNLVEITGRVLDSPEKSHCAYGEEFYTFFISCARLSGAEDVLPVTISHNWIWACEKGAEILLKGQLRSYSRYECEIRRLDLRIFAKEAVARGNVEDANQVLLTGRLCKPPTHRFTPLGREITDLVLAVERKFGKCDYIPVVCWGKTARLAGKFDKGSLITITGRLQSREYEKVCPSGEIQCRTTYEVSAIALDIPNNL